MTPGIHIIMGLQWSLAEDGGLVSIPVGGIVEALAGFVEALGDFTAVADFAEVAGFTAAAASAAVEDLAAAAAEAADTVKPGIEKSPS
jgi:hypothetical protein